MCNEYPSWKADKCPVVRVNRVIILFFAAVLAAAAEIHRVPTTGDVAATLNYRVIDNEVVIIDCNEDVSGELVLPSAIGGKTVTSIGDFAFQGCSSLSVVTIANSLTSIGNFAFGACTSLTMVTIPDSVILIKGQAFSGCASLTSIAIPRQRSFNWNQCFCQYRDWL